MNPHPNPLPDTGEGKGKETGDGPDMSSIVGYYTSNEDNFTAKTALTQDQILSIIKMAFGMGGGK